MFRAFYTIPEDVDAELSRLANTPRFPLQDAAQLAVRFRANGDVADLVAILDDPHQCGTTEFLFGLAGSKRIWLNWVPMPSEDIVHLIDDVGGRRAQGQIVGLSNISLSAAEPASALVACRSVVGPVRIYVDNFPDPDIRVALRPGQYAIWRYDGADAVPVVRAPTVAAVQMLWEVGGEPWHSPVEGYLRAAPLGELPLDDLLGLLAHPPEPPDTHRWQILARSTPTYWYRLMQPWVCLGILHHAKDEPWPSSTRREVLVGLAFGIEDWVSDAALFALVASAYRERGLREEVRELVRARLDAAVAAAANRSVSIEESLAQLMLITPGCRAEDRAVARASLASKEQGDGEAREGSTEERDSAEESSDANGELRDGYEELRDGYERLSDGDQELSEDDS